MSEETLKEWIRKELIISDEREVIIQSLLSVKDYAKQYIRLLKEKREILLLHPSRELPSKWRIYLYILGKAYGYISGIFENDQITNKELENSLKLPEGTVKSSLKELRDEEWIIQIEPGIHRLNYSKLSEAFESMKKEGPKT
ncbi:MAG: hypothetical protein QW808_04630 [Desulfurococcaceae archaeon]